ncbi:MAG: hypothetical protein ACPHQP_07110, partial [Longimicrobiales bacterium]
SIAGQLVEPVAIEGRPEFQSGGGRTLYGGGGITPDLFVYPATLAADESNGVLRLLQRGGGFSIALFNYAVEYVAEHPDLQIGFTLTAQDVADFYEALGNGEDAIGPDDFAAADRFVRYHLEREIALQAWGDEGEFRQLQGYDRQLTRAIEVLRDADSPTDLIAVAAEAVADRIPDRP